MAFDLSARWEPKETITPAVPLTAWYDTETDGLLKELTKMHCIAIKFSDGRKISAADQPTYVKGTSGRGWQRMSIVDALKELEQADIRIGHNSQDFDERAVRKVYPWFNPKPTSRILDTLLISRLCFPDIRKQGPNGHNVIPALRGNHSLKAWGLRLGNHKGDYKGGWATWSEDMQSYMEQDVEVLVDIFKYLMSTKPTTQSINIEHDFAAIIRRQEDRGFGFDMEKALTLLAKLQRLEASLETSLIKTFGEWWEYGCKVNKAASKYEFQDPEVNPEDEEELTDAQLEHRRRTWLKNQKVSEAVTPKANRRTKLVGYPDVTLKRFGKTGKELAPYVGPPTMDFSTDAPFTPIKRVEFNPGSRDHVRKMLLERYDWQPVKYTKNKCKPLPVVDDDILRALPYAETQLLANYYLVIKRLGQLSAGRKAWIKVAKEYTLPNGKIIYRIHGRVNTCGAATGRCTHMDPNLAQVPKNTAGVKEMPDNPEVWGESCRDLFYPITPYTLAGFDGSNLELAMLAHFLAKYDGGAYARRLTEGKKSEGTDPHSWLRDAVVGTDLLGTGDGGRDRAKTVMYAYLYGAGEEKLGSIVLPQGTKAEKIAQGKRIKERLEGNFPGLQELKKAIEDAIESNGFLKGLDGRILRIRKAHAALNTLLQSAGAVVMKQALICLDRNLRRHGLTFGKDYEFVCNIHDEAQAEVLPLHLAMYKPTAEASVTEAGEILRLKCPLRAEASSGESWAHTH